MEFSEAREVFFAGKSALTAHDYLASALEAEAMDDIGDDEFFDALGDIQAYLHEAANAA